MLLQLLKDIIDNILIVHKLQTVSMLFYLFCICYDVGH